MKNDSEYLGLDEVATYLKIPKSTIYKLSQKGELPSCKIGKQLRFRKSSIDKWVSDKESQAAGQIVSPGEEPSASSAPAQTKQVLLIDDDNLILRTISRYLGLQGYMVQSARNAEEALERVEAARFDLIITDIRMPGLNGIETIKQIRRINAGLKRAPSQEVVITGYMDTLLEQEAQSLGITAYIYKPFFIAEFLKTIQEKLFLTTDAQSIEARA